MDYKTKIKHAEESVLKLESGSYSESQVRDELKEKGLFDRDIDNIMASTKNIIGDKMRPLIRTKMLAGEDVVGAEEFKDLEPPLLKRYVEQEIKSIQSGERKKVNALLKEGKNTKEILAAIRTDFYPQNVVLHQIETYKEVKQRNSGGNRMLYILGGGGLMAVGGMISYASMSSGGGGRLFYGLIIVGLVTMIKGFVTVENPY